MSQSIALILLLLVGPAAGRVWCQEGAGADGEAEAEVPNFSTPYERTEFPEWAHALRRAEVVAIGSLPLTLFGVRILYDFTRYAAHGFAPEVAPFPFGPIGGIPMLTETEMLGIVIGAVALSVAIALIDSGMSRMEPAVVQDL